MLPLKFSSKLIHSITAQTGLTQRTNLVHSGSSANISCQMGLCKSGRTDPNLVCQWRAAMAGKATSITAGKFKHQLNLKCSWNSLGMFSNHHWWKITRIWITRCLCEGQNIPCLFFFSIALEEKNHIKVTAPQVQSGLSSAGPLLHQLCSEVQPADTNLSSEQRENSRKTQTNQTKEGGSCAIRRANLKCQVWQSQPSPGAAALVEQRLLPCCWVRAFPSSARGWTPPDLQWNPPSLAGKSLFVLQCCHHLHWTLQTWMAALGMTFHSGLFLFYQCTGCS